MKKFFPPLILAYLLYFTAGCNNSVTGPSASNVTFSISQQPGTQGVRFYGKPSVDVKLTKVISNVNTFFDTVNVANPNYVFSKDTSYFINEYTGVQTGQQWKFNFIGATASGNTAFNVTSSYTVP
jgi:hypothetical protein